MNDIIARIEGKRRELVEMKNSSPRSVERNRATMLLAIAGGMSQNGVHRVLGYARSTMGKAVRLFLQGGVDGLADGRVQKPPLIPRREEIIELIPRLVREQPQDFGWCRSTWSVELVAREVARQTGVTVSRSHMGRLLHLAGCRRVRPKPTVALAPADRQKQMDDLKHRLSRVPMGDVVLYSDEVDIHLNPKVGPDWAPAGMRKSLVTPGQNQKWYISGAFNPDTKNLVTVSGPRKNSDLFIQLVEEVSRRYKGWGVVHLVVDNYVIHHSKKTLKAIEALDGKIVLHYLPPYSPDDNPIERVWWDLHAHVTRNHRCRGIDDLLGQVQSYLGSYSRLGGSKAAVLRMAA